MQLSPLCFYDFGIARLSVLLRWSTEIRATGEHCCDGLAQAFQTGTEFWALAARKSFVGCQYFWPDDTTVQRCNVMHISDSRFSIAQSGQVNLEPRCLAVSNWFGRFKDHTHHAFWLDRRAFDVYCTIEASALHVIGQQQKMPVNNKKCPSTTRLTWAGPTWLEWPKKLSRLEWCCMQRLMFVLIMYARI